jgi:hypothetical protein
MIIAIGIDDNRSRRLIGCLIGFFRLFPNERAYLLQRRRLPPQFGHFQARGEISRPFGVFLFV